MRPLISSLLVLLLAAPALAADTTTSVPPPNVIETQKELPAGQLVDDTQLKGFDGKPQVKTPQLNSASPAPVSSSAAPAAELKSTSGASTMAPSAGPGRIANPGSPGGKREYKDPFQLCGQSCAFTTAAEMQSVYAQYFQSAYVGTKADRAEMSRSVETCLRKGDCSEEDKLKMLQASITYNFGKHLRSAILQNQTNAENMKSPDRPKGKAHQVTGTGKEPWLRATGVWKNVTNTLNTKDGRTITAREWAPPDIKNNERDPYVIPIDGDFGKLTLKEEQAMLGTEFLQNYRGFLQTATTPVRGLYAQSRKAGDVDVMNGKTDEARFHKVQVDHGAPVFQKAAEAFRESVRSPQLVDVKAPDGRTGKVWDFTGPRIKDIGMARTTRDPASQQEMILPPEHFKAEAERLNARIMEKADELHAQGKERRGIYIDLNEFNAFLEEIWPGSGSPQKR